MLAKIFLALMAPLLLSSCLAGAAIGLAGDVVEGGINATGAVVGAVIPDGDDKDDKDEDDD
jgi:hypothetical protein